MLNVNSPTVQAMMQNTPQGFGNMPVYNGSTPVLTSEVVQPAIPYPSPKEMLTSAGQQNVYAPVMMQPQPMFAAQSQFVGGYNPAFNAAFAGYTNPYMGIGYSGYGYGGYVPMDEETLFTLRLANENNLTFKEQLDMESEMYKKMIRAAGRGVGYTEEQLKEAESYYSVKEKEPPQPPTYYREPIKLLHVKIHSGDTEVSEIQPAACGSFMTPIMLQNFSDRTFNTRAQYKQMFDRHYWSSPERKADGVDIVDYLNNHVTEFIMQDIDEDIRIQNLTRSSLMYNSEKFITLLKNSGFKTRNQQTAVERYVGRYGVMPNGQPVSPGHDPAVAQSFAVNPATGQLEITAPNFIRNKFDEARLRFIQSIDSSE